MKTALKILACSFVLACAGGCGLTIGPVIENRAVIVNPGVPVELLENRKIRCHVITDKDGEIKILKQDVGGWVAMPPEHWQTLKNEMERLRAKQ